jgi:filamentous hemagglutinin family protein
MIPRSLFDKRRIILAGTSLAALALAGTAHAGPSGGTVSAGSASIAGDGTGHVTVTQTSDRAILDWNSFSIGTGESTRFIQPGSTSVAVNRVTGADPSSILGNLTANGRVVLINRNGIAFGKDATVDVGGLVATTADIDRQAFMATGSLNFSGGSLPGASVVNEGRITVRDAGLAALVAPRVRNSGTIVANLGRVALGAGTGFTVDFYGDGLVSFAPDGIVAAKIGDGAAALVEHSGVIEASGGKVLLSAAAARDVVNASVNVSGVVRADGISRKGGSIVLSGSGSVTANGRITADSDKQAGGTIAISGGSVSLGGLISASGTDGGAIAVSADGLLSLAETVAATGRLGDGGTIRFNAGRIIETATSLNDASGAIDGGAIRVVTEGGLATSGTYLADGVYGRGGRIDLSGAGVSLLSTQISARGRLAGGLVRVGGAFQGGKTPDPAQAYHSTFLGRWGGREALPSADTLFVGNAAAIDVSSSRGDGGTAVFWSDTRTTFLGSVDARGGRGGSVEISSAGDLRQAALDRVLTGSGGHLLLDPKNIVIGTVDDVQSWQYAAVLGAVYANSSNPDEFENSVAAALDTFDSFGSSVALNAAGTRMAVGASGDDGANNLTLNVGAVYLFSFSDGDFSNGTLTGIVGKGYTGGKNIDVAALTSADGFGTSVALNATGDLLAVGAIGDDGKNDDASGSGAAYLLRFTDGNFSGGTHVGTIGKDYNGAGDVAIALEADDGFGRSVSLNGDGDLLAIGAWNDDGFGNGADKSGAAYLVRFADTDFGSGTHSGTVGYGYAGAGDVDLALDVSDYLGVSVALNAAGDRLAIGAHGDDGFGNGVAESGAIHVIGFSDTNFSGGTKLGTIGKNYVGVGDTDVSAIVGGDMFGYAVAMNADGTRVAGTALGDNAVTNTMSNTGAVHLLSFANTDLSGGTYEGIIGKGYTGGKNTSIADLDAGDMFGFGLAFNAAGDRLAVGAYSDDGGTNSLSGAGGVYLMQFADGNFSDGAVAGVIGRDAWRTADIDVANLQANDRFGDAVALNAAGDRLAIGALADSGALNDTSSAGAVYLFSFTDGDFSGGTLSGIIGKGYSGGKNLDIARLQVDDNFGSTVALNANGTRLAIGALNDDGSDESTSNAGAVYLVDFNDGNFSNGNVSGIIGKGYSGFSGVNDFDVDSLDDSDRLGRTVALNAAGDRMAVGVTGDDGFNNAVTDSGAVLLFSLGSSTSLTGTIGAGYAGPDDLNVALATGDQIGVSVSLNAAGDRLAVGTIIDDASDNLTSNAGAVYLFSFTNGDFAGASHVGTIGKGYAGSGDVSLALDAGDSFGMSVSLNASGDRLAVGASGDAGNGNAAANAGAVYLFSFTDRNFSGGTVSAQIGSGYTGGKNLGLSNLEANDRLGLSVALNAAGDRLAVGAFVDGGAYNRAAGSGAVYLLRFTDSDFSGGQLSGILGKGYGRNRDLALNPGPDTADQFGISAALNGAGDRLAVGAFGDHGAEGGTTPYGAIYLFSFSDDQFSDGALEAIVGKGYTGGKNINLASLESGDGFGFSVALNDTGNRMAVGALGDDGFANSVAGSGAVHLFSFTDSTFSNGVQSGTIGTGYVGVGDINVALGSSDSLGSAVALNAAGDRLAVGAYLDDGSTNATTNAGAVYLFRFTDTNFGGGSHAGTIGSGYAGVSGMPTLEDSDYFGISVALNAAGDRLAVGASGDDGAGNAASVSGAVYLFTFTNADFGGGASAARIGAGYSGGKNLDLIPLEAGDQLGRSVAFNGDGNYLAVGANLDDGFSNAVQNAGAVYLFSFTDTSFSGAAHKSTIGAGYTGTWDTNIVLDVDDNFGVSATLSANGLRLAAGANGDDGASNAISNSGAVYLFSTERPSAFSYADHPDATVNISATSLAALLAAGTNLTLQASNDITVSAAVTVDNALGDGGDLTLQAGRSVLLNANITTDNGDLTLIGNDTLANGVVDAYRDSGTAAITMGGGTTITAGTGSVTIDLRDGAGKTNTAAGDITLRAITAGALTVTNASTAGDILLNGNITTSGAQDYTSERDVKLAVSTTIAVSGAATLGIDAARQLLLDDGSKIENTYSSGLTPFDAIVIEVNRRAVAATGLLAGIQMDPGAVIRTAAAGAGAINLSARGGATDGRGINLVGASKIESLGSGTITLNGTGGGGTGGTAYGVFLTQSSEIVGTDGDIEIIGESTGTGPAPGMHIFNGSQVRTTGTGDITLQGTASGAGAGVWISGSSASVRTAAGDITINATSAAGGNPDFEIASGGLLGVSGTNDITINADTVSFLGAVSGSGILTIQPRTDGRSIGLGGGTGDLAISAASLANIQNGFSEIVIGNADAGAITVGAGLSAFTDNLRLLGSDTLTVGGTLSTGSNRLTLDIAGGATQTEAITAGQLLLLGTDADYTLDHAGNAVATLAASAGTGDIVLNNAAAANLTVGTIGSTVGITAANLTLTSTNAGGDILINNAVTTTGAQDYMSERDIKLAASTTLTVSGAATLSMDAARQVSLGASSKIENTWGTDLTAFDAIVLRGNRRLTGDSGSLSGIDFAAGSVVRTAAGGAGAIDISGRGGTTLGHGIAMVATATIESLGSGDITLTGEAVNSLSNYSGILIGGGSAISSVDGDIEVTALSAGAAGNYPALYILGGTSATIQSTGTGDITLQGTRTTGDGEGVWIGQSGAKVQTASGNIEITGAAALSTRDAVRLGASAQVLTTAGGDITIEGTATSGGAGKDVNTLATSTLGGANTGDITINADTVSFAGTTTGAGRLTFQSRTDGRSIGIGTGAGDLKISAATLGTVTNGFAEIVIGNADAGAITVGAGLASFNDNLRIVGGSTLAIGGGINVGLNRLTLDIAGGTTQTAAISAEQLLLLGTDSDYTLDHTDNAVGFLAADIGTGALVLNHGAATGLGIGSFGGVDGITAGSASVTTTDASGAISIEQDVTTSGAQSFTSELAAIEVKSGVHLLVTGKATLSLTAGTQITIFEATLENSYAGDGAAFDAISVAANNDAIAFARPDGRRNAGLFAFDALIRTAAGGGGGIALFGRAGTGTLDAIGVDIDGSTIESLGTGAIEIAGHGGAGAVGGGKSGVLVHDTATTPLGSHIASNLGAITITGTAGNATVDDDNIGVAIIQNSSVASTSGDPDAGTIAIIGTGGGAGTSANNHGVLLDGALALSSDAANISITAEGGGAVSGTDNDGLRLAGTGTVIQSGTGEIVIEAEAGTDGLDFDNLAGSAALDAGSGRWILYLGNPDDSVFGGLASGSLPIWGQTIGTLPPASVGAGNRYVFAFAPTLTASTDFEDEKVYGDTYSWPTLVLGTHYALDGLVDASAYGDIWMQETLATIGLSGGPTLSSAGTAAAANVAGSPYSITIANGTLASSAGYTFGTPSSTGTLTVTRKALTLAGVTAAGKDYDGDTDADLSGGALGGVVGSDDVEFVAGSGTFASKNVGTWSITATGYTLSGVDAGNYTLTQPTVANATITAKTLTLTGVSAAGKDYDGNADADLSGGSLVGVIGSEDVEFVGGAGVFASKNAGTWSVTASGYTLSGDDAGNYTLTQPTIANATISPRTLNAGVTANGKTYDGTRDAALTFSTGDIVTGDSVTFAYDAEFADKAAGTGKAVSLTGSVTLTGTDAANYTLALDPGDVSALAADITARTLTVSTVGATDKIYDGGTSAGLAFTTADILSGDTVTFDYTANFADKNAGAGKGVTASGVSLSGADGGNYVLVLDGALLGGLTADIDRKALTLDTATVVDKTYDGNRNVTLDFTTGGLVSGDDIGFLYEARAADGNAGTGKAVTVTGGAVSLGGADADNYDLGFDPALLSGLAIDIAARTLNITAVAALDKVYDGTTTAVLTITATGLVGGDDAAFGYDARFANKNVGSGKTVSVTDGISLSGTDAGNYVVVLDPALLGGLSADITAKTLSITDVLALAKTYDGSRGADLAFVTDDIVSGDTVGFGYEALFADKNAGTTKAIDVTGGAVTLTGADAGNYALSLDAALLLGLSADIGRRTLTVTDVATADKTYDGTRNVPLDFTTADILAGDNIAFDYEALAADRNAGNGKNVTVGGVSLSGGDAGNYDLVLDDSLLGGLTTDVSAKALTVVVDDQSRARFQPNPAFTYHLVGLAEGDNTSVVSGVALHTAATGESLVGHYAIEASGGSAPNYVLAYTPGTLTVTGHLISPYDQDRIQHVPGSLSGSDGFGGLVSIAPTTTLQTLSGYADEAALDGQAPFCSDPGKRSGGQRLLPYLQLNMSGRTLYCLGSPSRFAQ